MLQMSFCAKINGMKRRISFFVLMGAMILSALSLYFLLNLSNPSKSGPIGVLAVFAVIYIFSFSALVLVIYLLESIYKLLKPQKSNLKAQENKEALRQRRTNLIAAALSLVPIFIISLNSIGELSLTDLALIVAIEALLIFYIIKRV